MKKIILPLFLLTSVVLWNAGTSFDAPFRLTNILSSTSYAQEDSLDFSALDEASPATSDDAALPEVDTSADAQVVPNPTSNASEPAPSQRAKFVDLVLAGGWIGLILLISSILAVSLIIRLCLTLRRSIFAPNDLAEEISSDVASGSYRSAFEKASQSDSLLGRALASGLREVDRGWNAVEKALEDSLASETAALYRRTDPLSVIGNVAPMLGLLGTVVGMVSTFGELAVADASGRNLANGIYFALVTTVDGLIVAIPVLVAHSLLNARVASLVSFVAEQIDRVLEPAKRELSAPFARVATPRKAPGVSSDVPASTSKIAQEPTSAPAENARPKIPSGLREVVQRPATESTATRPTLSLKNRTASSRPNDSDEA